MGTLKAAFIGTVFSTVALASTPASAIPLSDLGAASKSLATKTPKVVWVCGWHRCWWRPTSVYPAPYVYYRPYVAYWGWPQPDWGWRRWYW
jgi:hypothetical protein